MELQKQRKMLAVFAHPDDESFGPGGTLAKYAAEGVEVTAIAASGGEGSTLGRSLGYGAGGLGAVREEELRRAARELILANLAWDLPLSAAPAARRPT